MSATVLSIDLIVSDPAVRSGTPVVAGTTIRVSDLAAYHLFGGLSPDQLADQFALDLAQVHAALAYYFGHREELDAEIRSSEEAAARWCIALSAGIRGTGEDGLEMQRRLRREWDERCQALRPARPDSSR